MKLRKQIKEITKRICFQKSMNDVFIKIMMTVLSWGVEVVVELLNIKMFLTIF